MRRRRMRKEDFRLGRWFNEYMKKNNRLPSLEEWKTAVIETGGEKHMEDHIAHYDRLSSWYKIRELNNDKVAKRKAKLRFKRRKKHIKNSL